MSHLTVRGGPALLFALLGALLLVAAAGCAGAGGYTSGASTPPAAAPSGAATPAASDPAVQSAAAAAPISTIPAGTYHNPLAPTGPQTLIIGPGASFTQQITSSGQSYQGTLAQDAAAHVTFTNATGAPCAGQPGVYRANVDGSGLHLQTVSDSCPSRAQAFTSGPWTS